MRINTTLNTKSKYNEYQSKKFKYDIDMSVIIILFSVSITIAFGFLMAFIWSVKNRQYDDDKSPAERMLFDNFKNKIK
jgi:cbb3-type cytochrome oxidase maturation protein